MKFFLSLFALISLMGFFGCNRGEKEATKPTDTTIEREEDYRESDVRPVDEVEDVHEVDEVEIED